MHSEDRMADRTFIREEIEDQVLADYDNVAGKVILISEVQCYDRRGDLVEVTCVPPAVARITPYIEINENLLHWLDREWLEPYLDLTILEPHPAFANVRPDWAYGTCRATTGEVDKAAFTLAPSALQDRYKDVVGLDQDRIGACVPKEGHRFLPEQLEAQALLEYEEVAGKIVLLHEVDCYDEADNSVTVHLDPPVLGRIDPYYEIGDSLIRWTDEEHLDPYLDVSILEPHPDFAGVRPSWTFATCHSTTGEVEPARYTVASPELQERYKEAPGLDQTVVGGCAPQATPVP